MSLRWRLTLLSTLILAVLLTIFSVVLYFGINRLLYTPIDDNLQTTSAANLLYLKRTNQLASQTGVPNQFGSITFTVYNSHGVALDPGQVVPLNTWLFQKALTGGEAWGTMPAANGTRARVYLHSFEYVNPYNGQRETYVLQGATSLEQPDRLMSNMTIYLPLISVLLLLIEAGGSYFVAGRALRVVNNVSQKARRIETSQDLSQRIPEPKTQDEIGHLVKTFNQMLARLDAAFIAQRRFVADSSHELRTPLTVIRGNLHLLRRATDPSERATLISVTEAEISRLNRMVDDLLYMAQMQAGYDLKPVLRTVELDSLLLDVFALSRSMAALKEQKVQLLHEDVASCFGDRDQLQHLLLNLADNAVKYAPAGGRVTFGLWTDAGWARIEVSDSGPGIDDADLPHVFDRFFRTQEARSSEREGAGLGLAIVRSIAEAHGGRVEAFSKRGEGTTFRLWLPLAGTAPSHAAGDGAEAGETIKSRPARRRLTRAITR